MISSVKTLPVKVETPVEWLETDCRLHKSISRPTVNVWTNPIGVWPIRKRFKFFFYNFCGDHWFCNNPRPVLHQIFKIPAIRYNERIRSVIVNLRCKIDSGWSPNPGNAKNYDSTWSEVNAAIRTAIIDFVTIPGPFYLKIQNPAVFQRLSWIWSVKSIEGDFLMWNTV